MQMGKILISGAGIAGLSLAAKCRQLKIPFTLIEKEPSIRITGAGIALPANAVKALRHLGLGSVIENCAHRVNEIIYTKPSGQVLSRASLREAPLNSDYFVALYRKQLYEILLDGLLNDIIFNTTVKRIHSDDDGVRVIFDSPTLEEEKYSAIVGADGIYSGIRKLVFEDVDLVDLSVTTWRWTCNYPTADLQPTYMLGPKDAFMAYPISENTVYCYAHCFDPENSLSAHSDHNKTIKTKFAHYAGMAAKLLRQLPNSDLITAGRLRSLPYPLFSRGRVALVGDASSACSPLLQQGAASAFEDVIILSELLAHFPVEEAFKHYEEYRKERVTWIMHASDNPIKSLVNMSSPLTLFARNMFIKFNGPLNVSGWKTLLATDPIADLEKYIENVKITTYNYI